MRSRWMQCMQALWDSPFPPATLGLLPIMTSANASWLCCRCFALVAALTVLRVGAQAQDTSVVSGRVADRASGAYLNNARIAVTGTTIETLTNSRGEYQLLN